MSNTSLLFLYSPFCFLDSMTFLLQALKFPLHKKDRNNHCNASRRKIKGRYFFQKSVVILVIAGYVKCFRCLIRNEMSYNKNWIFRGRKKSVLTKKGIMSSVGVGAGAEINAGEIKTDPIVLMRTTSFIHNKHKKVQWAFLKFIYCFDWPDNEFPMNNFLKKIINFHHGVIFYIGVFRGQGDVDELLLSYTKDKWKFRNQRMMFRFKLLEFAK